MWNYESNTRRWQEMVHITTPPASGEPLDLTKRLRWRITRREQRKVIYKCGCGFSTDIWVDRGLPNPPPPSCPTHGPPAGGPPRGGNVLQNICDQCGHHRNMHLGGSSECAECTAFENNGAVLPAGRCWSFIQPTPDGLDLDEGAFGDLLMDRCAAALDNCGPLNAHVLHIDPYVQKCLKTMVEDIIEKSEANMVDALVGLRAETKNDRRRLDDIVGSFEAFRQVVAKTSVAAHEAAEGIKQLRGPLRTATEGVKSMSPVEAVRREREAWIAARGIAYRRWLTKERHRNHTQTESAFNAGWQTRDDLGWQAEAQDRLDSYPAWLRHENLTDTNDRLRAYGAGWGAFEAYLAETHPEHYTKQEDRMSYKNEVIIEERVRALVRETLTEETATPPLKEGDQVWAKNGEGRFTLISRVHEEQVIEAFNPERGANHTGKEVYTLKRVRCEASHWLVLAPDGSHRILAEPVLTQEDPNTISKVGRLMNFLSSRTIDRMMALVFGITIIYLLAAR